MVVAFTIRRPYNNAISVTRNYGHHGEGSTRGYVRKTGNLRRRFGGTTSTASATALRAIGTNTLRAMAASADNKKSPSRTARHYRSGVTYDDIDMTMLNNLGLPSGLQETLLSNAHDKFCKRIWIIDNSGSMSMLDGHQVETPTSATSSSSTSLGETKDDSKKKTGAEAAIVPVGAAHAGVVASSSAITTASSTCTRWDEVQETVNIHAQLSAALNAPTDFRLLNKPQNGGPQKFRVGYGLSGEECEIDSNGNNNNKCGILAMGQRLHRRWKSMNDSKRIQHVMSKNKPSGKTALHETISEIRNEVVNMLPQLQADGMKVAIIIATDGCNHSSENSKNKLQESEMNQELLDALESLQGLPVFVVIRLCTDYGPIVDFYNSLDERLDLSLDVLDDHYNEALQVQEYNPWLNYALVLHRMREMGQNSILFDLLDERGFTELELRKFSVMLFGMENFILVDDPLTCQWNDFVDEIDRIQRKERKQWNPLTKELQPWMDIEYLRSSFLDKIADEMAIDVVGGGTENKDQLQLQNKDEHANLKMMAP